MVMIDEPTKSYSLDYLGQHSFGSCFFSCFLGEKNPTEERPDAGIVIVSSFLLFGSLIIRTLILPKRAHNPLPLFVAGTGLAEAFVFVGIFVIPYYQDLFLAMSIACITCYIPVFTKVPRQTEQEEEIV